MPSVTLKKKKNKLEKKCYPLHFKFCKKKKRQLLILWHIQKLLFLLWIRDHIYITLMIKLDSVVLWLFFFCLQVKLGFFTWWKKNTEEIHQNLAKNVYTNFSSRRIFKIIMCYAKSLQSCPTLCDHGLAHQIPLSMGFSRQEH